MPKQNILQYTGKIWSTADLLIASGIKQSDFPKYMMPFFGLVLLESRMIRAVEQILKEDFDVKKLEDLSKEDLDEFKAEFIYQDVGFNEFIVLKGKTLKEIVKNDKTFTQDFDAYLDGFDGETREVLGVGKTNDATKRLNITGVAKELAGKKILFSTVKKWSEIDLTPFDNSDITSLEEHIKFKWADISADTAGEQYTPKDVIQLMSDIVVERIQFDKSEFVTVYDPTCGGGNLLFGVADDLDRIHDYKVKTYGQDWSDTLYALAWIESRFRKDSEITYGNTLTESKIQRDQKFSVVVANPPHGISWTGFSKEIYKDETERFITTPSTSDGQLLFAQHILHHLHDEGIAVVVHNGSALFSGDAGSGESDIRKHFFDNDWVEAIIQLPTSEFFNTGIHTYIWLFNKNKPKARQNKVMLIDGSDLFVPLKKSFGSKRREIDEANRQRIVKALADYEENDFAKIFDKDYFYFNKQAILLQNLDEDEESFQKHLPWKKNRYEPYDMYQVKAIKFTPTQIQQDDVVINEMTIINYDEDKYEDLKDYFTQYWKPLLAEVNYKEKALTVSTKEEKYWFDKDKNTIVEEQDGKTNKMGCGKILIKGSFSKATKTREERILIHAELTADNEKDYEVIPYSRKEKENDRLIDEFLAKYIFKPFEKLDRKVGVEINFNKVFYQAEALRPITDIKSDIAKLDKQLADLEKELNI